jgi:predicted ribosomally synthesized peptide with nif11-like leader
MSQTKSYQHNIQEFFRKVREDSGIQGQISGALAEQAPDVLAKIASDHGFQFSGQELSQLLKDRAQTSLQGEVFWTMVTGRVFATPLAVDEKPDGGFIQIKGPVWVQTQPYRRGVEETAAGPARSLAKIYDETCGKDV